MRFVTLDRSMKVIQVTSPGAGDGKSTVVANLAVVLAQAGHSVAIVSCDLRGPTVHSRLGEPLSVMEAVGGVAVGLGVWLVQRT